MQKYGNDPMFKELLMEFSALMGNHFTDVADKKQKEEEEKMKDDPVMKTINEDPQVKAILAEPKVQKVIHTMQQQGGMDFHAVARQDPELGQKLMILI